MKYGTVGMKQYLKVAAVLAFLLCTGVATATPCTPSLSRQVIWVDQSFLTCIPLSAFFLMAPKANGKAKGKAKGKARGKPGESKSASGGPQAFLQDWTTATATATATTTTTTTTTTATTTTPTTTTTTIYYHYHY